KFHTSSPGETGEGEIHSMRLERLAAAPAVPSGTRLSLFDFNIHKMRDDWPGWIRFVRDQRLRPPDIVFLQDVENDAARVEFQTALGEAFGGAWNGAGTDPEWQTAIVWRKRRFTRATHRAWRGFGGKTCVDDSQDAPAVQVKLYDTLAKKWVSLVSLKTPPQVDDSCVWSNVQKVDGSFRDEWAADLCVIGTDANSPDRVATGDWASWYRNTVRSTAAQLSASGTLGFCDPVADVCGLDRARADQHVTLKGKGRVDFLLLRTAARTAPSVVRQMTLPLGNASGVKWSDHHSVHAEVAY
ncbi:MAG: endonuclease/exonuclease/phosphatase family protein, partial [Actinomycetota bacterium]|nr:endonuclease/exonuclease/phosphatase family protein [Actinomycetota bacterium]